MTLKRINSPLESQIRVHARMKETVRTRGDQDERGGHGACSELDPTVEEKKSKKIRKSEKTQRKERRQASKLAS
jgi:hypothetical protein